MQKICKLCNHQFEITSEEKELYKKFDVPEDEFCFKCAQTQRLAYRNERNLYSRKCDFSGEQILSVYSADKPFKVYKSDIWYSDKWDPMEYGRDFDFSRPFFDQFYDLHLEVPRLALLNVNNENSEYCNFTGGNKNCYLVFGGDYNTDVMYGTLCMQNKDSLDLDYSNKNELSYFLNDSIGCYGCIYTFDSKNCNNCAFISDCTACNDCILCTNLVNKSYCIFNEQHTKEEYLKMKDEILNGGFSKLNKIFLEFKKFLGHRIVKNQHSLSCENCEGDYLKNSKNCINCFDISDSQDLRNIIFASKSKDCLNCSLLGDNSELCYGMVSTIGAYNCKFCQFVLDSSNSEYGKFILNCENTFGCFGLRRKKNCILNKQYSEEGYKEIRGKIVEHMKKTGEWGKFFPPKISDFAYNESIANEFTPLTKEEVLKQGYTWKEKDRKDYKKQDYLVPDLIKDVPESITNEILACSDCGKNFKILQKELEFYKKFNLPIPQMCPDCRHKERMEMRNPRILYDRKCMECGAPIKTTYTPERTEKVFCEKCYLKEVY
ncbi:hypothetical protein JW911_03765 [Candidatus Peregrinibacteria bacterium]|nr:hypothetical protein [Candidatus Peregrinibacteria bacterium]